jgi:two-component system sensor histidine kinase/response regulator
VRSGPKRPTMIWTIEPASPWRITAADSEAGAVTDAPGAADPASRPSLLDSFDPEDRPAVEAALARAKEGRPATCACYSRAPERAAGILALAPVSRRLLAHAAGAGRPAVGGDRTGAPDEIVAAWTPTSPSGDLALARAVAAATSQAPHGTPNNHTRVVDDGALRQFLGMLGHDLRSPLNGVLGMSRLLLDSGLRMDQIDYARAIDTSAEHLLSVIEDLLEFATLDVETPLHPVDFCPRALVEDVVESLAWRAAEKDTEICAIVSASVPELVEGDAARLRQVLGYLVSDGINSTGVGDVVVRVSRESAVAGAADQIVLRFEVTANETAVTERQVTAPPVAESRNSIAEANPRAAVCRHLVSRMGGQVGTQTDGVLRTGWFTTRVKSRPAPPAIAPNYVSLIGRRVICVDDHPLSQRVLLERLRGWNLDVDATDEAHSALTLMKVASAAGHPFELAILDLRLPGMDGLSLARLIKSDPVLSPTRLVLLTGYPARGQAALAQEAGIDAYLQKPIREAPLRSTIEMLLGGGHASARPLLTGRRFDEDRNALRPRVLVAENNPVSQKVAVQMLEKLGCRVDVVSGGAEAVQAIETTPYHLVLMECQLPGMDGLDAARRVRGTAGHKISPPILALTGDAGEQERDACLAAGMNDFVVKPLRLGTLREKLAQWIEAAPR